jgi:hypothetical protein
VVVEEQTVRVFHGTTVVATHRRSYEPFARVVDAAHFAGLWRPTTAHGVPVGTLAALGRDLADYDAVVSGAER